MKYAICHFVFLVVLFGIYRVATSQRFYPDADRLAAIFDAEHYDKIRKEGYSYNPEKQSNVAFFPAFPYLWRWLGVNSYGITIFNILLFYTGIYLWLRHFRPARNELLLYLSLPSMFFMYFPYSEPLFFVTALAILIGFKKNNMPLIITGLVLSSLTRSAANVFLPALILMELISANRSWPKLAIYCVVTILSVVFVSFVQFQQTGEWLGFMQTQQHWGHELSFPKLPFLSWGDMLLLDAFALLIGFAVGCVTVYHIYNYIRFGITVKNRAYLFSILCISGLTLITLIFKMGYLFSLNRYFMPTAFFAVAGGILYQQLKPSNKTIAWAAVGIFLFFISFHFFLHISAVLKFALLTAYCTLYLFTRHFNTIIQKFAFWILYILNCGIQVYLADIFIAHEWVG